MQEITPGLIPGSEGSPGREWLPTPVFLPGEFYGQKSLVGYSPWSRKQSDMAERLTQTHGQTDNSLVGKEIKIKTMI